MMAISLWQPWAWLVACGEKSCETRSWATRYRGPIAIHAAKRPVGLDVARIVAGPDWIHWARAARGHGLSVNESARSIDFASLDRGCIVAFANLTNVVQIGPVTRPLSEREIAFGDYTTGRYRWDLTDVRRLREPIPMKGHQGLWRLSPDVSERLTKEAA